MKEQNEELKLAVEALLFASDRPLPADEITLAFEESVSAKEVEAAVQALKADYEALGRGFKLAEIAGGWQIVSDPRFSSYLKRFYQSREKKKLAQASLVTLSVIAYKQPVTRAEIEFIRGVTVDGAMKTLVEKGLVKIVGRKEVPGRPMLYGTTKGFLEHFGLNSTKELPALQEFSLKDIEEHLLPPELKQRVQSEEAAAEEPADNIKEEVSEERPE